MIGKTVAMGTLAFVVTGVFGCEGGSDRDVEQRFAALGGTGGGDVGCPGPGAAGAPGIPSNEYNLRGFNDATGLHTVDFKTFGFSTITQMTGRPLANGVSLGGNLMAHSTPWGYKRHDGPSAVVYIDANGHVHERGSLDFDFAVSFGINAPIAASAPLDGSGPAPDIIGYVRSDNQSALVYRSSNNHVIEIKSNFSSQPPWLATDLTVASGASVTVNRGSPFPYVRSDGWNTIVYIGSDNHIHELATLGSGWSDGDLTTITGGPSSPFSDLWGYQRSDSGNAVVYVGSDSKLHELALFPGGSWSHGILPAAFPLGGLFHRPSGYVRGDGVSTVVYASGNNVHESVHELALLSTGWSDAFLSGTCTRRIGQTFGHAGGIRGSILYSGTDATGVVTRYELSLPFGGSWSTQSL